MPCPPESSRSDSADVGSHMTSDQNVDPPPPPPAASPARRYSTGVVIGAGLGGLAVGALAVFAVTGPTWKVRVEFAPPPYPAPMSTPLVSYVPSSPPAVTIPSSGPSVLPPPAFPPPGQHP
jgi:hypothetical protein